ncbi:unnamed protein product, partial [Schistosoma curassoni]|uniref:Biogenesis of lysosome-related organelles complex 1 subunit CNL1 n=1 Tax=Schistosoma curassoni TaxID=6186 RepID=A0A183JTJ3_9TREM
MQISQTNLKTDITTTPNTSDGGEGVVTEPNNQSSPVSPSGHILNQLDQYTAQTCLSLLKEFQTELNQNNLYFDEYRNALYNVQSLDSTIDCLYSIFKQFDVDINDDLKLNHSNLIHKLSEELEQFQMSWEQLQTEVNTTHQTMYQHLEQVELFNCKQLSVRKLLTEIEQKACLGPCST